MHNGFTRMMTALWKDIGLGDPVWSDQGTALLHLEELTVELMLSEDGRLVLAALDIAPLAADRYRRDTQIDALLRLSLLGLTANRGAICFQERNDATVTVVRGLCPCEIGLIPRLSETIADLIDLRNECLQILARDERQVERPSDHAAITFGGGSMIFAP